MDLFYKEGIGLNFAVKNGAINYLKDGEFAFYSHLILENQRKTEIKERSAFLEEIGQEEFEVMEDNQEQLYFSEWYLRVKQGNFF